MASDSRMDKAYETILFERKGHVCSIMLNRPQILNAVSDQLAEELNDAFFEFDADPECWVGILSGAGRAFCSGADVRQRQTRPREELVRLGGPVGRRARGAGLAETVNWKPMIAAVHGYALGAGYALMQACDIAVAAKGTRFQITEVRRGLGGAQHWAATWFWSGSRFANEVALTGRMFTAEEALQQGMINRVVPASELMASAEALAAEINENPPMSVRCNVRVMRHFAHEMEREATLYQQALKLHLSEDFQESARAFLEKRPAMFQGR